MRLLKRNTKKIWYMNAGSYYPDEEDGTGYYTGENTPSYSTPQAIECTVIDSTERVTLELFGANEFFDKIVLYDDSKLGIAETTMFFIDTSPETLGDLPDYKVVSIRRTLNFIAVGVRKVG